MRRPIILAAATAALAVSATGAAAAADSPAHASGTFTSHVFAQGAKITHMTAKGREAVSNPDDISRVGGDLFVGFQNGIGPQGQASPTGNLDSTIVELSLHGGRVVRQWDIKGKCDGLTANPSTGRVVATVNEDAHSSLYVIDPSSPTPVHYRYNVPLPSRGGTDAIEFDRGKMLISASAPGTTGGTAPSAHFPAVYVVDLHPATHVAHIQSLFGDEAAATVVNTNADHGARVHLALTDPDSNEDVPAFADRFAGDFMLTSQGDKEQIFVSHLGTAHQRLSVLHLSDSVDDTVWASSRTGAIYADDTAQNRVMKITGAFRRGQSYVADTPCDANGAPTNCPAKGYPANYLGSLNPDTGVITPLDVRGPAVQPQGMDFVR